MGFAKNISPRGALSDIVAIFKEKQDYKLLFFLAAAVPPILLVTMFYNDAKRLNKLPPPEVFYFESWDATRNYQDIVAEREGRLKLREALLEERRQKYKLLGRASGIDVDKIEAETAAAREKVAKERQAFEKQILERAAERQKLLEAQDAEIQKKLAPQSNSKTSARPATDVPAAADNTDANNTDNDTQ